MLYTWAHILHGQNKNNHHWIGESSRTTLGITSFKRTVNVHMHDLPLQQVRTGVSKFAIQRKRKPIASFPGLGIRLEPAWYRKS